MNVIFVNSIHYNEIIRYPIGTIPLGTLTLATILKKRNHDVKIIDFNYLVNEKKITLGRDAPDTLRRFGEHILKQRPEMICFYTVALSYHNTVLVARHIKERSPQIPIIFGGPHASHTPYESMKAFPWIDVIAVGEADHVIERIVGAFSGNENMRNIPGILYREDSDIRQTKPAEDICNLSDLPEPDYSLTPFFKMLPFISIDPGRSCPFRCKYCSTSTFWKNSFRLKSIGKILEEIKYFHFTYQIKNFYLTHDIFTYNRERLLEFCEKILEEGLDIRWSCSSRADTLDEEMIVMMKKSGCKAISLGIDSGSPRIQKVINKNLNPGHALDAIKILCKYRMDVKINFMVGFPEETEEDVLLTLKMMRACIESGVKNISYKPLMILAGTKYYDEYKAHLVLDGFRSYYNDVYDYKYCVDMIKKYPKIFSHFYNIKIPLRQGLNHFALFIKLYYIYLHRVLQLTYEYILAYYEDNFIKIFYDFRKANENFHEDVIQYRRKSMRKQITDGVFFDLLITQFKRYLFSTKFGEMTSLIRFYFQVESGGVERGERGRS